VANYNRMEIGALFFGDLKGGDEVFVAFEAGGLAEKAFGGVYVADHANQGRVRGEPQLDAQIIFAGAGE